MLHGGETRAATIDVGTSEATTAVTRWRWKGGYERKGRLGRSWAGPDARGEGEGGGGDRTWPRLLVGTAESRRPHLLRGHWNLGLGVGLVSWDRSNEAPQPGGLDYRHLFV